MVKTFLSPREGHDNKMKTTDLQGSDPLFSCNQNDPVGGSMPLRDGQHPLKNTEENLKV